MHDPPPEAFRLDGALSNLVSWKVPRPIAPDSNYIIFGLCDSIPLVNESKGHELGRVSAAGCLVWEEAMNCPVPLGIMSP